jgi:hypothetical protein
MRDNPTRPAAAGDDYFGVTLNAYQRLHDLGEAATARRLGVGLADLARLRLCPGPASEADLAAITERFGIDLQVLAELVAEVRAWPR